MSRPSIVTADLPPFVSGGSRIDVAISSLGDATSLMGGTLLMTQMRAADGEVYAVAQGAIAVGGYRIEGAAQTVSQGVADVRPHSQRCADRARSARASSTTWNCSCSN